MNRSKQHLASIVGIAGLIVMAGAAIWAGANPMAVSIAAFMVFGTYAAGDRPDNAQGAAAAEPAPNGNPDFSIIVPACDEPEITGYLAEITATVTDARYEIVVVDDSVGDATSAAVRQFGWTNPAARVIRGPRQGRAAAIAAGVRDSLGTYVLYVDAGGQRIVALLPRLIAKARAGYDLILPARDSRRDPLAAGRLDDSLRCRIAWALRLLPWMPFPRRRGAIDVLNGVFGVRRAALRFADSGRPGWRYDFQSFLFSRIVG